MDKKSVIDLVKKSPSVLLYLTSDGCNVCKTLKPAIQNMLKTTFPEIHFFEININENPEIAAHFQVFSIPVILVFFEGNEFIRKGRAIGISELENEIKRPYSLLFE